MNNASSHVARQLPKPWQIQIGKDIHGQVVTRSCVTKALLRTYPQIVRNWVFIFFYYYLLLLFIFYLFIIIIIIYILFIYYYYYYLYFIYLVLLFIFFYNFFVTYTALTRLRRI